MNRKYIKVVCIKVVKTNNYKGLYIRHTFVKREKLNLLRYTITVEAVSLLHDSFLKQLVQYVISVKKEGLISQSLLVYNLLRK